MAQIVSYPGGYGVGDTELRVNTTGNPPVSLGEVGYDANGIEYRYVRAGGAAAAGTLLQVTASVTPFDAVVVTSGANQQIVGAVGATAFATNDCGWVIRNGPAAGITGGTLTAGTNKTTAAAGAAADAAAADVNDTVGVMLVAASGTMYVKGL